MPLFDLQKVGKQDLQGLIHNKIFENKDLEYKDYLFASGKMPDKIKDKFMKEIAAFANTNGGTIILGLQEDENRLPTKLSGVGCSLNEFDNWLSSFRQLVLSRIRPHLHGVEAVPVELDEGNIAIVISVPKSYARPHSFWDGNKDEFFMRYANGIMYMDIDDLRKEFLYANGLQDKIRQFRKDRISMILANECVGDLGNEAKIVFHIIPEWSFELGNRVDLGKLRNHTLFQPISGDQRNYRYNVDGYCITASEYKTRAINSYTQMFHSGIVEAVEIRLISNYVSKEVFNWHVIQGAFINSLSQYGELLDQLSVPKPWHVFATILNGKGYFTSTVLGESSSPLERNIVNALDGICTEDFPISTALKPVFDSLSNAFGFRESGCFEPENETVTD